MHTHKCGFWVGDGDPVEYILTPVEQRPSGCGYEWSHDDMDVHNVGEAASEQAHKCPRCGAGPWVSHCGELQKRAKAEIDKVFFPHVPHCEASPLARLDNAIGRMR